MSLYGSFRLDTDVLRTLFLASSNGLAKAKNFLSYQPHLFWGYCALRVWVVRVESSKPGANVFEKTFVRILLPYLPN